MSEILLCDGPPEAADFLARFADAHGYKLRVSRRFQRKHILLLDWSNIDAASAKPRFGPWRLVMRKHPLPENPEPDPAMIARHRAYLNSLRRGWEFICDARAGTLTARTR